MDNASLPPPLQAALADRVSADRAHAVSNALLKAGVAGQVSELLEEFQACSAKIAGQAVDALPELVERCGPETVVVWMDLAIALAGRSGAMSMQYLKESPRLLGVLASSALRREVAGAALELADGDSEFAANCALAFFRHAPALLAVDARANLARWAEVGRELTEWNQVLGIEFFRECPKVAEALAFDEVRAWVAFGMKLITQNSLGTPDYVGILEFFRTSPGLIGAIPDAALRPTVVSVGSTLADRSPEIALTFLAEAPMLVDALPSAEHRHTVLRYGGLLAERDAAVTMEYFRRAPEVVRMDQGAEGRDGAFETWFRGGMEVLDYSVEGARAYFALDTAKALHAVEQAMHGVPLRHVARSLQLLAHMICGQPVRIASLADAAQAAHMEMTPEGPLVWLPAVMNRFSLKAQNVRSYTVALAHEVGHVAFGTYHLDMPFLRALAQQVAARYHRDDGEAERRPDPLSPHGGEDVQARASLSASATAPASAPAINGLADFFALYPQQGVIRDLWTILEDARVEFLLQREYPGLRHDLAEVSLASVTTRSLLHGMTAREMVLDHLLLLLTRGPGEHGTPHDLREVVDRCWTCARTILHPHATHEQSVELADRIYQTLDAMIGSLHAAGRERDDADPQQEQEDQGAGPRAAEETAGGYRAVTNWAYRGAINPDFVRGGPGESDDDSGASDESAPEVVGAPAWHSTPRVDERRAADHGTVSKRDPPDADVVAGLEEALPASGAGTGPWAVPSGHAPSSVYPEWDGGLQDYRLQWCRVVERPGEEGRQDFAPHVLEKHAPAMRVLRRYFETLRPTAWRRVHGCDDGEDVDLDAAIRRVAERRAGVNPSDRIYDRRDKRERHVAVAFLVDMSGSTGRQLEEGPRRVIDVEKEALVLLAEALDAIGDDYALYGFSGQGRHDVEVIVLKDFGDTRRAQTGQRIEAMTPLRQNRDGAAIRHVTHKLLRCPARHRVLMLLSDGRPLDGDYGEEYALQDTRMALREARQRGIRPFCVTIDREASGYLKRMYGDIHYCVLDDVRTLPERLPRMYQRLTGGA